jgi:hypothetical protein
MIDIQYLEYHLDSIKTVKVLQNQGSTEEDVCKDFGITGDWFDILMFMTAYRCRYG